MIQNKTVGSDPTILPTLPHDPPQVGQQDLQLSLPPLPKGNGSQGSQTSSPLSYKTKDLSVSDPGMKRLEKTLKGRQDKLERMKNPPKGQESQVKTEKRATFKTRADKFFKEFKSVFKNTGKAIKSGGDGAKYIGGSGHDFSKITGGIGAGAQIVETGFDIYLAKVKIDKAKTDLATVETSSPEVIKQREKAQSNKLDRAIQVKSDTRQEILKTKGDRGTARLKRDNCKQQISDLKLQKQDAEQELAKLPTRSKSDPAQLLKRSELEGQIRFLDKGLKKLELRLKICKRQVASCNRKLKACTELITKCNTAIQEATDELGKLKVTGRMKGRTAEKDLNSYNDSVPLERAKMVKSLWDGQKATTDIGYISTAGTVVGEGFKLSSGVTGVVVGPLTLAVNTYEMVTDVRERSVQLALKEKSTKALKEGRIDKDDGELVAIAQRLQLKQKKQSVDKGLSATKNFFGALGGVGTAVAGGLAIAGVVGAVGASAVAIATPVGWGLAGAAALAAIGYGIYKLARHLNSSGIKESLQKTIQNLSGKPGGDTVGDLGLTGKDAKAMAAVTKKMVTLFKAQGIERTPDSFTVDEVRNYASKKLLARDTGVATASLYSRFKDEAQAYFTQNNITDPTPDQFQAYIDTQKDKVPVKSAVGLMNELGLALNKDEARDMFNDSSSSDSIKWLSKKLKLA